MQLVQIKLNTQKINFHAKFRVGGRPTRPNISIKITICVEYFNSLLA